jgi:hypothetical protein
MNTFLSKPISKFEHGIHFLFTLLTGGSWLLIYVLRIFFAWKSKKNVPVSNKARIMDKVEKMNSGRPANSGIGDYQKRIFANEDEAFDDDWSDFAEPYRFEIVGESYKRDKLLSIIQKHNAFSAGELEVEAVLKMEADNKFDSTAVAVFIENKPVGYVSSDYSLDVTSYLDDRNLVGIKVKARIGWDTTNPDPAIGVRLDFNF